MRTAVRDALATSARLLRAVFPWASGPSDLGCRLLSAEEFEAELLILGLSGKRFGPSDYARALAGYYGMPIKVHEIKDHLLPDVSLKLARSGRLAQLRYSRRPAAVDILVPASLPPLPRVLAIYHELGHLSAGDHDPSGAKRLALREPHEDHHLCEEEADLRASYSLVAGSLGPENPYHQRMYDVL